MNLNCSIAILVQKFWILNIWTFQSSFEIHGSKTTNFELLRETTGKVIASAVPLGRRGSQEKNIDIWIGKSDTPAPKNTMLNSNTSFRILKIPVVLSLIHIVIAFSSTWELLLEGKSTESLLCAAICLSSPKYTLVLKYVLAAVCLWHACKWTLYLHSLVLFRFFMSAWTTVFFLHVSRRVYWSITTSILVLR